MTSADDQLELETSSSVGMVGDALGPVQEHSVNQTQARSSAWTFVQQTCRKVPPTPAIMEPSQMETPVTKTKSKGGSSAGCKKGHETRVRNAVLVKQYEEQIKALQAELRERDGKDVSPIDFQDNTRRERVALLENEIIQLREGRDQMREAHENEIAGVFLEKIALQKRVDQLAANLLQEREYSEKLTAQLGKQQSTGEVVDVEEILDIYCQYPLNPPVDENEVGPLRWRLDAIRHLWNRQTQLSDIKTGAAETHQQTKAKYLKLKVDYKKQHKALVIAENNVEALDQYEKNVRSRLAELIESSPPSESPTMDVQSPDKTAVYSDGLVSTRFDEQTGDVEMDDDR